MDTAERDQYQASVVEWAQNIRDSFDALTVAGFTETQALTLLVGSFTESAGQVQARAVEDVFAKMMGNDG